MQNLTTPEMYQTLEILDVLSNIKPFEKAHRRSNQSRCLITPTTIGVDPDKLGLLTLAVKCFY